MIPIPPRPAVFSPDGAPPGVEVRIDAYETLDDGYRWLDSRPYIKPRVAIAHTNAASREASAESQIRWGHRTDTKDGRNTTKPHYCVNAPTPIKTLATNRRAIANSTGSNIEAQYGEVDCSFWSIAIETADMGSIEAKAKGYDWPTDCGPFLHDHAEIVARILAYESIVWHFPLMVPSEWNASGVVTHTEPWPYPYYTTAAGKTCPGSTKKWQTFHDILPRARLIRDAWLDTPSPEEDDMILIRPTSAPFNGAGLFTLDGQPISPEVKQALDEAGDLTIVEQNHAHWNEATLHKMGEQARRLYGDRSTR